MNHIQNLFRRGEVRTVFLSLVVLVAELIAVVGLACANWSAGDAHETLPVLSDWTALVAPVAPLTVFFLNLLP